MIIDIKRVIETEKVIKLSEKKEGYQFYCFQVGNSVTKQEIKGFFKENFNVACKVNTFIRKGKKVSMRSKTSSNKFGKKQDKKIAYIYVKSDKMLDFSKIKGSN